MEYFDKKNLETLHDSELLLIVGRDREKYRDEAVKQAAEELNRRGVGYEQVVPDAPTQHIGEYTYEQEEELSLLQKVLFIIFPVIALIYLILVGRKYQKKKMWITNYFMILMYISLFLITARVMVFILKS